MIYIVFINLKKTYDYMSIELLWRALEKKRVRVDHIRVTQEIYEVVVTRVETRT